jgi:hypothetical protein
MPIQAKRRMLSSIRASARWHDPAVTFARYHKPALVDLGRELAEACEAIAATAL